MVLLCYGLWALAGLELWPAYPPLALMVMALMVALHSSLCHEVCHGHPTRHSGINEALVSLPLGLVFPFRRFKTLHLRHHADDRLTDPFDDPESYYHALWKYRALPVPLQWVLRVNNTFAGRLVLGPLLMTVAIVLMDSRLIAAGDKRVLRAWIFHGFGLLPVVLLVAMVFSIPLWIYILTAVWLGHSLIFIRTFAEHRWSENVDGRTVIVQNTMLAPLFLNNNLHLVHHKNPTAAWYLLPEMFRADRDQWISMNEGYVFSGYTSLLLRHAFRAKEPVVHPVLRRDPEPGLAFSPLQHQAHAVSVDGMPVPAEAPRK